MNCTTCIFFLLQNPKYTSGRCRRYPPTVIGNLYERDGTREIDWSNEQPWVGATDWCGEWKSPA